MEKEPFDSNTPVEMPRLISSIINGCTLKNIRLLVTSRPGALIDYDAFDIKAEIYGFTRTRMSDYIEKFCGEDDALKNGIEECIDGNVNICSFCYIPVQLNLICHLVRANRLTGAKGPSTETLTELFVVSVENFVSKHHSKFKDKMGERVHVTAELKDTVLKHAKLAKYGIERSPIQVSFSKEEIQGFHLEEDAKECGLLTESSETAYGKFVPEDTSVYYFSHLTLQEFLAAVALVTNLKQVTRMMKTTSYRQLDLTLMFLAGLVGNAKNDAFLRSLGLLSRGRWSVLLSRLPRKKKIAVDVLIKLVVERERRNEASLEDQKQAAAHRSSTLLLLLLIYESQQRDLWHHVSHYILLKEGTELNLYCQHVSPVESQAVLFILPMCVNITVLK